MNNHDKMQAEIIKMARGPRSRINPEMAWIYSIPNGQRRTKYEQRVFLATGGLKGVWDLHLPVARGGYHGLWIEIKEGDDKLSKEQENWGEWMTREGHLCVVVRSVQQGFDLLIDYFEGKYLAKNFISG